MGRPESIGAERRDAEGKDENRQQRGFSALPAQGEPLMEEKGVEKQDNQRKNLFGIAGKRVAPGEGGPDKARQDAGQEKGKPGDNGKGVKPVQSRERRQIALESGKRALLFDCFLQRQKQQAGSKANGHKGQTGKQGANMEQEKGTSQERWKLI